MDRAQRASLPATVTTTLASLLHSPNKWVLLHSFAKNFRTFVLLICWWAVSKQPCSCLWFYFALQVKWWICLRKKIKNPPPKNIKKNMYIECGRGQGRKKPPKMLRKIKYWNTHRSYVHLYIKYPLILEVFSPAKEASVPITYSAKVHVVNM